MKIVADNSKNTNFAATMAEKKTTYIRPQEGFQEECEEGGGEEGGEEG